MIRYLRAALAMALMSAQLAHASDSDRPDLVLVGEVTGKDSQSYRNIPFNVPEGTTRVTVQFDYDGAADHTVIDLGLLGPGGFKAQDGFRGWSGGTKHVLTVSATDATPSYLPGAIQAGRWELLLGIPNARSDSKTPFNVNVWFGRAGDPAWKPAVLNPPLRKGLAWYRGDLHMHTAHSDGQCSSQSGKRVSCPVFLTVMAAAARKLDFIAITDHNTLSQVNTMRELQPYFDQLLLMPGSEITTFSGHANVIGLNAPLDFRVGTSNVPDWNTVARAASSQQAVLSINHAIRPTGEMCMGCAWTAQPDINMQNVQAIEIVNGGDAGTEMSGIPFWDQQLNAGYRITGIAGSDNHNAVTPAWQSDAVGRPTTVVQANALSTPDILDGVRAGHVFVDVEGTANRSLAVTAHQGSNQAAMGDTLIAPVASNVTFEVRATHSKGGRFVAVLDGKPMPMLNHGQLPSDDASTRFDWTSDGKPHWLRIEVHGADNSPLLYGNPVYLNR